MVVLSPVVPCLSLKLFSLRCRFSCVCTASAGRTVLSDAEGVSLVCSNSSSSLLCISLLCGNKIILSLKPFIFSKLGAGGLMKEAAVQWVMGGLMELRGSLAVTMVNLSSI